MGFIGAAAPLVPIASAGLTPPIGIGPADDPGTIGGRGICMLPRSCSWKLVSAWGVMPKLEGLPIGPAPIAPPKGPPSGPPMKNGAPGPGFGKPWVARIAAFVLCCCARLALRSPHALQSVMSHLHFGVFIVPHCRHLRFTGSMGSPRFPLEPLRSRNSASSS